MQLAVRKDGGELRGLGGYHYMLHPIAMANDSEAAIFELMGYVILEVPEEQGNQLLRQAREALNHQVQVAVLTEKALAKGPKAP